MAIKAVKKPTTKEKNSDVDVFEEVNAAFELPERKMARYAGTLKKGPIYRNRLVDLHGITPEYLRELTDKYKSDDYVYFEEGVLPFPVGERIGSSLRKAKFKELLEALESRYIKR